MQLRFKPGPRSESFDVRFWEKVGDRKPGECWLWLGGRSEGYGIIGLVGLPRRTIRAHRAVLMLIGIPIPEGHHVHHRCGAKLCVNPDHLEMLAAGDHGHAHSGGTATSCSQGHHDNFRRERDGSRTCRDCEAAYKRQRRARVATGGCAPSPSSVMLPLGHAVA